jgi:hypothetical protein
VKEAVAKLKIQELKTEKNNVSGLKIALANAQITVKAKLGFR